MKVTSDFDVPPNCRKCLLPVVLNETAANEPAQTSSRDLEISIMECLPKPSTNLRFGCVSRLDRSRSRKNSVFGALGYSVSTGTTGRCEGWSYCKPAHTKTLSPHRVLTTH